MRKLWSSVAGVIAVAALLIGLNLLADTFLASARLDLTQQRIYTLSAGTRKIVAGLKQPITLRLFYSRQLGAQVPVYGTYADRVREMLRDYAAIANGNIKLEFYDPEPFSDIEDRAMGFGLQGVPMDRTGTQVYFGLAGTNLLDDQRTVPFFQPERERFLEYDLTRLIHELSNPKLPVIGVMTSLPLDGDQRSMMMRQQPGAGPWVSMLQLRQAFSVKTIALDAMAIPDDVTVLLLAHAQHLNESALYAIDQFVMRGGKLMALVDPKSEMESSTTDQTGAPVVDVSSDLKKLFDAWGVEYDPSRVVGDLNGAWRVRTSNQSDRVQAVDYVPWFNIREAGIARDDPALADLTQISVAAPGALAKKDGADIEFTPLLSTSEQSGTIALDDLQVTPDPAKVLANFKPDGKRRVIAARVRGTLKSAFAAPPPLPEGKKRPDNFPAHKPQSDAPVSMVLMADSDIMADRFWVRVQDFFGQQQATPFSDNGAAVLNLTGTLAGSDDLVGLRGRRSSLRPFEVVDDMQRRAETQYRKTEQDLQAHLAETEKKLTDLRTGAGDQTKAAVITPEQRAAIDDLQRDVVATRGKLRGVQLELRREIDGLEMRMRLFNIVLVPAALAVVALGLGLLRRARRARARA